MSGHNGPGFDGNFVYCEFWKLEKVNKTKTKFSLRPQGRTCNARFVTARFVIARFAFARFVIARFIMARFVIARFLLFDYLKI